MEIVFFILFDRDFRVDKKVFGFQFANLVIHIVKALLWL